jgi:hypothetical protein
MMTNTAKTLLLHTMVKWLMVVTEEFLPFAVHHACIFQNASVRSNKNQSPYRMFTGN